MAHPYHHAVSSAARYGGKPDDYLPIHNWFDASKVILADFRHRALRHHAEGCFLCEQIFGTTLTNSDGKVVPVRWIAEQHVKEDLGWIPSAADWLRAIKPVPWMLRGRKLASDSTLAIDIGAGPRQTGHPSSAKHHYPTVKGVPETQ